MGKHRARADSCSEDDQTSRIELFVTTRWPSRCWTTASV